MYTHDEISSIVSGIVYLQLVLVEGGYSFPTFFLWLCLERANRSFMVYVLGSFFNMVEMSKEA